MEDCKSHKRHFMRQDFRLYNNDKVKEVVHLLSSEQFEHEDSDRPIVGGEVVTFIEDDLRGNVLGGATECPRLVIANHFGETEVTLKHTLTSVLDVLLHPWLYVPAWRIHENREASSPASDPCKLCLWNADIRKPPKHTPGRNE